jgi:chromosome segregation ATPase
VAVDWAEWFVRRGITDKAVAGWQAVGQALGLTAENLAQGLADALQQFGSLEAVIQAKAAERDALAADIAKLTAANAALREEQATIRAGLEAVAQEGRTRITRAEKTATAAIEAERTQTRTAMAHLDARMAATLDKLAALEREAAELQKHVGWARALASRDQNQWQGVEPEAWAALVWHLARWIEAAKRQPAGVDSRRGAGR